MKITRRASSKTCDQKWCLPKYSVPFSRMLRDGATSAQIIEHFEMADYEELRRIHKNMVRRGMKIAALPAQTTGDV